MTHEEMRAAAQSIINHYEQAGTGVARRDDPSQYADYKLAKMVLTLLEELELAKKGWAKLPGPGEMYFGTERGLRRAIEVIEKYMEDHGPAHMQTSIDLLRVELGEKPAWPL